ncbi:MAG: alpha/beta hydrolase [Lachnospiraceae bacterium]|jgi:predicted alpha/beta superfamily hydrolase|nr:alpha/beta hydrolase [Lachnospiraceae bacterium]
MVRIWKITIPQLTGDKRRRAYIYLPRDYEEEPGRRYPVLYMFDGHNVFFDSHATYGKSWGMKEYMDESGIPLIIAAVECNHDPDNGRLSEYSPYSFDDSCFGSVTGRGEITMDWLVHTFKRQIDCCFRTLRDREHTFIAGSSMGGLMSLYALFTCNDVFSRAAALSPSLWVDPPRIEELIRETRLDSRTVLYMDYGSRELARHEGMARRFGDITALLTERQILLESRIVPGGEHCEASWERQIPFFMNTLLYDYTLEEEQER